MKKILDFKEKTMRELRIDQNISVLCLIEEFPFPFACQWVEAGIPPSKLLVQFLQPKRSLVAGGRVSEENHTDQRGQLEQEKITRARGGNRQAKSLPTHL